MSRPTAGTALSTMKKGMFPAVQTHDSSGSKDVKLGAVAWVVWGLNLIRM
jgi:hypothetical protein